MQKCYWYLWLIKKGIKDCCQEQRERYRPHERNPCVLLLLLEICSGAQGKDSCSMARPLMLQQSRPASPSPPVLCTAHSHHANRDSDCLPRAVVSNSHFPLVKIELGLSLLSSPGDEERRCWGISLKHAAASVLMAGWQAGINPCAHPWCFFQVPMCPKRRSPVPQRGAGGVHRAATVASSTMMVSQEKKWHRRQVTDSSWAEESKTLTRRCSRPSATNRAKEKQPHSHYGAQESKIRNTAHAVPLMSWENINIA